MLHVGRVAEDTLRRLRDAQSALDLSYAEVGATRDGDLPAGYNHDRHRLTVGSGADDWERAKEALRRWQAHRSAGVTVYPADAALREGETVALGIPVGPLVWAAAACRIVWTLDEADRFGFGYGTLPAHAESGEEAFVVERAGDPVDFAITVFSRPVHPVARASAPIARLMQKRVTQHYLDGVRSYVATGDRATRT